MAFVESVTKVVSVIVLMSNCFLVDFRSSAQVLPVEEVEILEAISIKLKINNWTITQNSCTSEEWNMTIIPDDILSNVTCDCTFKGGNVCHVTNILLKGYNLTGTLPEELGYLTYLQEIDFSRNYINGSIPTTLAQLSKLRILSLLGNRISGSIPPEVGNITTLEELVLEDNLLGGPLHSNLGNLKSLRRLLLSANNFTGRIPNTFGNLKNLTDFRIDGSQLSGKIPEFIGDWTSIERL
uniref:LRR-RLK n=1 Tax=Rhizophora mucronata TaxID=61149 RepID=A0A2P2MVP3_RHIMU